MENYQVKEDIIINDIEKIGKLTLTIKECAALTGIGEIKLRELVHTESFPVIWVGNRALIIRSEIEKWLIHNIGQKI